MTLEQVRDLCHLTPAQRFANLRDRSGMTTALVDRLQEQYGEFLSMTQRDSADVIDAFGSSQLRRQALEQAGRYGETIYELLHEITPSGRLRYLVI